MPSDLVSGLNDAMGAGTYAYVDTGAIGTDAIKRGLYLQTRHGFTGRRLCRPGLYPSIHRFMMTKNRPALAQTFMDNETGGIFTAVVNHLKSKGSDCDDWRS